MLRAVITVEVTVITAILITRAREVAVVINGTGIANSNGTSVSSWQTFCVSSGVSVVSCGERTGTTVTITGAMFTIAAAAVITTITVILETRPLR
jgi:hypothetical protein